MVLIDWNKVTGTMAPYQGHFGVLTGFDKDNVHFHNSGPANAPDMRIRKETFMDAWNANGTDNDVLIVYGKR